MKTSISVSIDLNDDFERSLFDYVMSKGKGKKSGYIKRLIYADKVGLHPVKTVAYIGDDQVDEDKAAMNAFF